MNIEMTYDNNENRRCDDQQDLILTDQDIFDALNKIREHRIQLEKKISTINERIRQANNR